MIGQIPVRFSPQDKMEFEAECKKLHQKPATFLRIMALNWLQERKAQGSKVPDITQAGKAGPAKGGTEKRARRAWKKSGGRGGNK